MRTTDREIRYTLGIFICTMYNVQGTIVRHSQIHNHKRNTIIDKREHELISNQKKNNKIQNAKCELRNAKCEKQNTEQSTKARYGFPKSVPTANQIE